MTISGMTGFARAEGEHQGQRWIWELKSVNGRGLDLKLRTPQGLDALEPQARAAAAAKFKRGSLQANLSLAREASAAASVKIDFALVDRLIAAGENLVAEGKIEKPRWDGLLSIRGVLQSEETAEASEEERAALESALMAGFAQKLEALAEARQAEGRSLASVFSEAADRLEALIAAARLSAAAAPAAALERIRQKLEALAPEVKLDPARLAQEAAIAATKADVAEELERLSAHTIELRSLLTKPEPAGRRLDFLSQELTREANTLCSKSADLELTRIGLNLKTVVDQIKEQAANVE
ncbi:YicC/YloC family endoribonuclease [Terricaulis sp.]|uniref:YicC/YloC family endoribonuclease n=1 Tax=Terricaulis sp. TaxID=2768686 RepID=UPI002AC4B3F1|nr:YicC/YloC family endoribonuclease [Terricaulis sp.]MDZ4691402.1 YicC/YloC family endoribonuclease [Terricaulis sp.]